MILKLILRSQVFYHKTTRNDNAEELDLNLHSLRNLKSCIKETGREVLDCIQLAQDRFQCLLLVNTVINLRVIYVAWNFCTNSETINVSRNHTVAH